MPGPAVTREGAWSRLQAEVHQNPKLRQRLIRILQRRFEATVVSFFVSFSSPDAIINDDDAEMLESLLSVEHKPGRLILVLNAPGGFALAAERIVNVCRKYAGTSFEVVVPHMAKSAATMICFGAAKLHMSVTAELGPVDPQVVYPDDAGNPRWISAAEYIRAYDGLIESSTGGKAKRIEPFLQQLQRFDARHIESLKSAQALSKDISLRLLRSGMMQGQNDTDIEQHIEVFLTQQKTSSHGRMVSFAEAKECGLTMEEVPLRSPLWNDLWDLYVRSDWTVTHTCKKLLESAASSLRMGTQ